MIASCSGGGLETGNSEEEEDAPAVISDFIYQGASLHNQTDRTGETALHLAARYSRSDAAKRLLEASADANIQDNMGRTPLHAAVSADAQGVFQVGSCSAPLAQRSGPGRHLRSPGPCSPGPKRGLSRDSWCLSLSRAQGQGGIRTPRVILAGKPGWGRSAGAPGTCGAGPPHPDPARLPSHLRAPHALFLRLGLGQRHSLWPHEGLGGCGFLPAPLRAGLAGKPRTGWSWGFGCLGLGERPWQRLLSAPRCVTGSGQPCPARMGRWEGQKPGGHHRAADVTVFSLFPCRKHRLRTERS